ncbi:MAG: sel1 repeat family protein, partial [Cyanobacteria bacterium]|nr:sel1 repeat family protein [Cyanobacteriota bacterium]
MKRVNVALVIAAFTTLALSTQAPAHAIDAKKAQALKDLQVYQTVLKLMNSNQYSRAVAMMESLKEKYPKFKTSLGAIYIAGEGGIKKNQKEGLRLLEDAARKHADPEARLTLGQLYFLGEYGVKKDYKLALGWLGCCGAEPEAFLLIGQAYEKGWGVSKDFNKAISYLKRADAGGAKEAKTVIGRIYLEGGNGIEKNPEEACRWLESEARVEPKIYFYLWSVFCDGEKVKPDFAKARNYLVLAKPYLEKQAAKGEETCKKLVSLVQLAEKNYDGCKKTCEEIGGKDSESQIGMMYGCCQHDYASALPYHKSAAEGGSADSMGYLGEMYYKGQGLEKNLSEARKWFEEGAREEDGMSNFYLGKMYARGEGVEKDLEKAKSYFKAARPLLQTSYEIQEAIGLPFGFEAYIAELNGEFRELSPPDTSGI